MRTHRHIFRTLFCIALALWFVNLILIRIGAPGIRAAKASSSQNQAAASSTDAITVTAKSIDDMLKRLHNADKFDGVVLVADEAGIVLQKAYGTANFEWDVPHTV